ncbi:MAG: serine/threonine protein kinase [Kofleriaceae bacterium]|nr:serine/threonine protein kinase [Kofleriaceae bacterium]
MPALVQDYELQSLIAVGAMAEVWRGVDRRGDRPVAIKLLHSHLRRQPEVRALFLAEQQLLTTLPQHCGLVQGLACDDTADRPWLVMSLAHGHDLRHWVAPVVGGAFGQGVAAVKPQALPHAVALDIAARTADAVAHLHQQGWVHGDIGPSNIVVDNATASAELKAQPNTVILCDLGIARPLGAGGPVRGTHAYMAPEQVRGENWTTATDVFSLGVLLWELCSGQRLFHRGPPFLSAAAVVEAAVPALGHRDIDLLLTSALAKPATARMQHAAEFAQRCADILPNRN